MTPRELPPYAVVAHNGATRSDNKIHDDEVARQYGFSGGLVPGVTVYAYMTHPIVSAWGLPWLERGTMSARFLKPFYEGEEVTVQCAATDGGTPTFEITARNPAGDVCAIGTASLPAEPAAPPAVSGFEAQPLPSPVPPVSYDVLARQTALGTVELAFSSATTGAAYLSEVPDAFEGYYGPDLVAPAGLLIRMANSALAQNVRLNPWIHVSSSTQHFSLARDGEHLTARSNVVELFERKGHKFVRLDVLVLAGERPVLRVDHTAIYDIRPAGSA